LLTTVTLPLRRAEIAAWWQAGKPRYNVAQNVTVA
jgi:hypothetical protein